MQNIEFTTSTTTQNYIYDTEPDYEVALTHTDGGFVLLFIRMAAAMEIYSVKH